MRQAAMAAGKNGKEFIKKKINKNKNMQKAGYPSKEG